MSSALYVQKNADSGLRAVSMVFAPSNTSKDAGLIVKFADSYGAANKFDAPLDWGDSRMVFLPTAVLARMLEILMGMDEQFEGELANPAHKLRFEHRIDPRPGYILSIDGVERYVFNQHEAFMLMISLKYAVGAACFG